MIRPFHNPNDSELPELTPVDQKIPNTSPENSKAGISAITRLQEAYDSAYSCNRDPWEFSMELAEMQKAGIETHVLRTLICNDLIIHRKETTGSEQDRRSFEPVNSLALSERSCFVISKQGYAIARSVAQANQQAQDNSPPASASQPQQTSSHHSGPFVENNTSTGLLGSAGRSHQISKPIWDRDRRELRFGDTVVKRFKWPAENQELVLNAFQDLGWPIRVENPLAAHPSICPKRRLHDTLKCLNRKQVNELIKFRGDGTGLGVLLEINVE